MSKIYLPNFNDYKCVYIINEDTMRAYKEIPRNNSSIEYTDFYFNSNYYYKDGIQTFNQYTTLPVCLDNSKLTDNYIYRNDFSSILLMFFIISIFVVWLPYKIFSRFFGRWFKI